MRHDAASSLLRTGTQFFGIADKMSPKSLIGLVAEERIRRNHPFLRIEV
jgi:hypothetical protein